MANPHIVEQMMVLRALESQGYTAVMTCGFDETIKTIDDYLGDRYD